LINPRPRSPATSKKQIPFSNSTASQAIVDFVAEKDHQEGELSDWLRDQADELEKTAQAMRQRANALHPPIMEVAEDRSSGIPVPPHQLRKARALYTQSKRPAGRIAAGHPQPEA